MGEGGGQDRGRGQKVRVGKENGVGGKMETEREGKGAEAASERLPAEQAANSKSGQTHPAGRCCLGPQYPQESAGGCAGLPCPQCCFPGRRCPSETTT